MLVKLIKENETDIQATYDMYLEGDTIITEIEDYNDSPNFSPSEFNELVEQDLYGYVADNSTFLKGFIEGGVDEIIINYGFLPNGNAYFQVL